MQLYMRLYARHSMGTFLRDIYTSLYWNIYSVGVDIYVCNNVFQIRGLQWYLRG